MKPYSSYKDSDILWLGEIPSHWDIARFDHLVKNRKEEPQDGDEVVTAFIDGVVTLRKNVREIGVKNAFSELGWKRIHPGDLAISGMNAHLGGMGVSDSFGKCSPIYLILPPKPQTNAYYFSHILRLMASSDFLKSAIQTIRFNSADFKTDDLKSFFVPVPPREEQDKIVNFLNSKLADIDRYIAEKERLIELLQEQKTALINQAVTHGLNPKAKMKSSGIDWLGEIPEHWGVHRLKFFSSFVTSGSRGWADFYSDEGFVFLRIGNLSTEKIDLKLDNIQRVTPPKSAEGERTRVLPGDLLISITALIGAVGVVPSDLEEAYVNQHTALVRLKQNKLLPRWVAYCLHSSIGKKQFNVLINGGTKDGLGLDDIKNLLFLLPQKDEQTQIVNYCDHITKTATEAIKKTTDEIELLNEYRTALIAEAVTGKIDVRS